MEQHIHVRRAIGLSGALSERSIELLLFVDMTLILMITEIVFILV